MQNCVRTLLRRSEYFFTLPWIIPVLRKKIICTFPKVTIKKLCTHIATIIIHYCYRCKSKSIHKLSTEKKLSTIFRKVIHRLCFTWLSDKAPFSGQISAPENFHKYAFWHRPDQSENRPDFSPGGDNFHPATSKIMGKISRNTPINLSNTTGYFLD